MPTKTRKRKTTASKPKITAGTTYHVLDGNGVERAPVQTYPPLSLVRAQKLAQDDEMDTFYVERRTVFGNPVELYRVLREEDGTVVTITTNLED